jgi:hypothetical protein
MGFFSNIVNAVTRPVTDAVKQVGDFAGDVVGGVSKEIGKLGSSIDDAVRDIIPGGWTTLAEVGISFTPAGPLGSAAFGAASGGTGGFRKKFDLSGAIMGGLQGYGIGSMTQSLASAAAPNPYGSGSNYDLTSTKGPEAFNATTEVGSMPKTDYSLQSSTPNLPSGSTPVDYSLSNTAPSGGINSASSAQIGYTPAGEIGYTQSAINPGQFPTAEGVTGITNPNFGGPPAPSGLENFGSSVADKASQVGQGIKNLTGFGPQGVSGIIPAAQAVNAGMSYTAYSGLGSIALQEMEKKNQEAYEKGQIPDAEYLKNQQQIDKAIADANAAVDKYTYEPESQLTTEQPTFYGKKQRTLYDEMAQSNQPQTNFAFGGTVENHQDADDMATGGLASGFNFNSGNQMPMYAIGGVANGLGSYAGGGSPRFLSGGGDGMSDSIHAKIDGHQEARLADGEFVIPADVVSHLGNGSSKAGAKQLHAMMDRIRKARTGNPKQGKQINPLKLMPA